MKNKVNCEVYLFYETIDGKRIMRGIKPVYKTTGAACADVAIPFTTELKPHTVTKIDLWIGFEIPKGYKILMYPRSSLLVKYGIIQPVSIIDSDYSGQHVHVPLFNASDETVLLEKGTRVAQIECVPVYDCPDWEHEGAARGEGGFGSTGTGANTPSIVIPASDESTSLHN